MPRQRKKPLSEINVVPYIDVMLVLLVIFMITAPLLSQGVHVNLPQASAKAIQMPPKPPLIVSINQKGEYFLNTSAQPGRAIALQTLKSDVKQALLQAKQSGQKRDVYVKGDRNVDYGKVMSAMVLLQQAGADSVGLITQDNSDVG